MQKNHSNYLAVLGRQPEISLAELEALFVDVSQVSPNLAIFTANYDVDINRLGGTLKLAEKLEMEPLEFLRKTLDGKITIGVSDYSIKASRKAAQILALKLKKELVKLGRSVRVVENKEAVLSTAASLYNGLSGKNPRKIELVKVGDDWYKVIGVQDIDAYARRDQARPARDAKVGMLPPKLAQILINLCGPLPVGSRILDPFCGTGVVLQEALLMGYQAYGTDVNERMVEYTRKNLKWLSEKYEFSLNQGDATSYKWDSLIDAVACEGYLGEPMSQVPTEMKLKEQKQVCEAIVMGFLRNLGSQIKSGTPVVIAVPAWLREDGSYSRLEIVDRLDDMGYNVNNKSREGILYVRVGQIVARDILILRKK